MNVQHQDVIVRPQRYGQATQQWSVRKIERAPRFFIRQSHGFVFRRGRQARYENFQFWRDLDAWLSIARSKRRSQRLVPERHQTKRRLQSLKIERAANSPRQGNVIGSAIGNKLIEEPDALLRGRQRKLRGFRESPHTARNRRFADLFIQLEDIRIVKQRCKWKARAEFPGDARCYGRSL